MQRKIGLSLLLFRILAIIAHLRGETGRKPATGTSRFHHLRHPAVFSCLLCGFALGSAGCGGGVATKPSEKGANAYEGVVLKVACPNEVTSEVIKRFAPGWGRRSGARVEVVVYDPKAPPSSEGAADIWVIAPWQLGRWGAAGDLLPMPESFTSPHNSVWTTLLPLYRDQALLWGRTAYALPLLGESPLFFYRTDLLVDAKLDPPATWEEFEKAAAQFHDHPPTGFQGSSLPPLPVGADALDREYFSIAAPFVRRAALEADRRPAGEAETFSFHYDTVTGKSRIAEPGFVHALALLQRLQAFRPRGDSPAPEEAFRDGRAVFCLADASWIAKFQKSLAVHDKFGIAPMPGANVLFDYHSGETVKVDRVNRVPYLGAAGWLMVVPKTTLHADAAFALLEDLNSIETSRQIVTNAAWGGGAIRDEHLAKSEIWNSYDLPAAQRTRLVEELKQTVACPGLKNPAFRLRIPDEQEHEQALIMEIRAALVEGKDPSEALKSAAKRWEESDRRVPLEERKTQYLRSLELHP
jgi:ABC-type glycerol-3-phosphate transport system substrate-binding protein